MGCLGRWVGGRSAPLGRAFLTTCQGCKVMLLLPAARPNCRTARLPAGLPCPAPPAEINTAFELLHSGKCLRCVLTFDK